MTAVAFASTERPTRIAAPGRGLIVLLAAITLAAPWAASAIHLTEDECTTGCVQALQFGYYAQPPMIAWWIRAGTAIAGDTALGVRLLPVPSCGLTSLLVFDPAQRLGASARTAERPRFSTTPP